MRTAMRRFVPALAVALGVLAGTVPQAAAQQGGGRDQRREEWQKIDEIFQAMLVRPGATIADVGAGDGFFTTRLAKAVGPEGRVLAVDIGADALRRLRQRIEDSELTNVEVIHGEVDDPKLPAGTVDAILIVNAYHEMTEYQAMLTKMKAALKPGGRLVIVEPISPLRRGRPRAEQTKSHEIDIDFVRADAAAAGFAQVSMQDPFTARPAGRDEEWMLVLTPGTGPAQTTAVQATAPRAAAQPAGWESPDLRISMADFKKLAASGNVLVVDVRDPASYEAGHLPNAVLMTPEELARPGGIAKLKGERRPIVTYCS